MKHSRDLKESDPEVSNSKRRIVSDEPTVTDATVPDTIEILGDEYEVEAILGIRDITTGMTPQFYVKWKGYPDSANTWEPLGNLEGCHDILKEFLVTTFTKNMNALTQVNGSGEQSGSVSASVSESPSGTPPPVPGSSGSTGSSKRQKKLKTRQASLDMEHHQGSKPISAALQAFEDLFKDPERPKITLENDVDDAACPAKFKYITKSILGEGVQEPDPEFASSCNCKPGMCSVENGCACMIEAAEVNENETAPFESDGRVSEKASKLLWECNSKCGCGSKCISKASQKGRMFALKIKRFPDKGWGVILNQREPIPPRTFVSTYVGEIITTQEADMRDQDWLFDLDFNTEQKAKYAVDACQQGNESHFFNHSCDPNMSVYMIGGNMAGGPDILTLSFWSNRWIHQGDELTFDYKGKYKPPWWASLYEDQDVDMEESEIAEDGKKRKRCLCGSTNCRKWI